MADLLRQDEADSLMLVSSEIPRLLLDAKGGYLVLAFPRMAVCEFNGLEEVFRMYAYARNVSIDVCIYDHEGIEDGQIARCDLGYRFGRKHSRTMTIHAFGKEFFCHPDAEIAFISKINSLREM